MKYFHYVLLILYCLLIMIMNILKLQSIIKIDDHFNYALYKQLFSSLHYKNYNLRSVQTGLVTNIGSFDRQYPYRETEFFEFDKFLFTTWRDKHKKGKDQIPWGVDL